MHIKFSPQRSDKALKLYRRGSVLEINDQAFDFSLLPDGCTVPEGVVPCDEIVGPIDVVDGVVHLTIRLPHGPNPSQAVAFPSPVVDPSDGPIGFPVDVDEEVSVDVDA